MRPDETMPPIADVVASHLGHLPKPWRRLIETTVGAYPSPQTRNSYSYVLRTFFAAHTDPAAVAGADVTAFINRPGKRGQQVSAQWVHSRLSPLVAVYRAALDAELVTADPTRRVRRPKLSPAIPRGLDLEQLGAFMRAIGPAQAGRRGGIKRAVRNRALFSVAVYTGLRLAEVLTLTAGQLVAGDPAPEGGIRIRVVCKGRKRRHVLLPPPTLAAIRDYLALEYGLEASQLPAAAPLWYRCGADAFRTAVAETARAARLPRITVHSLRHAAAKARLALGADLRSVSAFLGHSALSTTDRYVAALAPARDTHWRSLEDLLK